MRAEVARQDILILDDTDRKRREVREAIRQSGIVANILLAESPDDALQLADTGRLVPERLTIAFIDMFVGNSANGGFQSIDALQSVGVPIRDTPRNAQARYELPPNYYADSCVVIGMSGDTGMARDIGSYSRTMGPLIVDWYQNPLDVTRELREAELLRAL